MHVSHDAVRQVQWTVFKVRPNLPPYYTPSIYCSCERTILLRPLLLAVLKVLEKQSKQTL